MHDLNPEPYDEFRRYMMDVLIEAIADWESTHSRVPGVELYRTLSSCQLLATDRIRGPRKE